MSHGMRRFAAMRALLSAGRAFAQGSPAPRLSLLARELRLPTPLLEQVLLQLSNQNILVRTEQQGEPAYVPARPLESIRLSQLFDAVDRDPQPGELEPSSALDAAALRTLEELKEQRRDSERDPTLAELVRRLDAGE